MKKLILITCAFALASCATKTSPFPSKRPLPQASITAIGKTSAIVNESALGVSKSWFQKNSSYAAQSVEAALILNIADSIANARPAGRARRAANAMAEFVKAPALDSSLVSHLKGQIVAADAPSGSGITLGSVTTRQRILMPEAAENALELTTT